MTDLNSDPIDIGSEAYNDPSVLYVGSSIPHHMTTGAGNVGIAVSSFAAPDAHYEAASSVSGGITIPTATTLLGDAKVEEGVEVMSTQLSLMLD